MLSRARALCTKTMNTLLEALLSLSEKTARIARHFHMNKASMLIEEKSSEAKNKRFTVDYKTVADTLIQVVFKHFLGEQVRSADWVYCTTFKIKSQTYNS